VESFVSSVKISRLRCVTDARGLLFEPLDDQGLTRQRNVHVVISEPGVIRGNHKHLKGSEVAAVQGPCLARFEENGVVSEHRIPAGEVWQFEIPAGVAHAYQNTGSGPTVLVGFNTEVHDPAASDTQRVSLLS
jgi:dTDP-4-dehydrorhamnose 3,5-epimerase-like enzyme